MFGNNGKILLSQKYYCGSNALDHFQDFDYLIGSHQASFSPPKFELTMKKRCKEADQWIMIGSGGKDSTKIASSSE